MLKKTVSANPSFTFITEPKKTQSESSRDELLSDMSSSFGGNPNRKIGEDVIKGLISSIRNYITENRIEFILLLIILIIGTFLRLYRISEYMTFLGDEGRDAIIVRRFLVNFDPILIGPGTSIGNMYLGPLYYYFMAPFLFLCNFSPVGPAVAIAILGIITIFFVWYIVREWFSQPNFKGQAFKVVNVGALVAAGLYAVSSVVVNFSRSSWNPNIMPFFSLLSVYSIWRVWKNKEFNWLIVLGISFAFILQSHYLGLLLGSVLSLFWLLTFVSIKNSKFEIRNLLKKSVLGLLIFLVLMSPLLIFDMRHNWMNFNAMKVFFTERQTTVSARPWSSLPKIPEIATQISTSLLAGNNKLIGNIATLILGIYIFVSVLYSAVTKGKKSDKSNLGEFFIITFWILISLVGLGLYKQHIYDHYYGFFFAAPFILIGSLTNSILCCVAKKSYWFKLISYFLLLIAVITLIFVNLKDSWFFRKPNNQLNRSVVVSQRIIEESAGKKFNFAVIAERNYEGAYQYFLEKNNANFVMIDPQLEKETVTDQLFVVCELPKEKCDPVTNSKAGIANFGWSKIDQVWEVDGVFLYKLGHNR